MDTSLEQKMADLMEDEVLDIVRKEVEAGTDAMEILNTCRKGVVIVGDRYAKGVYFVSDLMMAGEIFKQVNAILAARLGGKTTATKGKVVFGTVAGDIHDIGKDLVVGMLRSVGYDVTDLGVDVPKERFVEAVRQTAAPILGLSGLLTIAFDSMRDTIKALEEAGLRLKTKVIVGGGPVNDDVRRYTGADGWGNTTQAAIEFCKEHIS
jgi:methanogenic corrinoid protein MtbC1